MKLFSRSIICRRGIVGAVFLLAVFLTYYFSRSTCAADGLVPCKNDCNLCYLIVGISNIFQYLTGTLLTVAVVLGIVISGLTYIISGAFPKVLTFAKSVIGSTMKGAILALIAWIIINGIMNIVGYKHPLGGKWYQFDCTGTNTSTTCDSKNKNLESIVIQCAEQKETATNGGSGFYVALKTSSGGDSGKTKQLKAIGKYSCDGATSEEDISSQAEWKSSDETQIKVAKGLVQAVTDSLGSSVPYVEAKYKEKSSNQAKVYINACPNTKTTNAEIKNKFSFSENSFVIPKANAEDCPACGDTKTDGTGCGAAIEKEIEAMTGWIYTSEKNKNNDLRWTEGYGDCSSTTSRAYTRAGCENPGESTYDMYQNASSYSGDTSSLKAGDTLVWNNEKEGHVGTCLNDGCTQIMGASTETGISPAGTGATGMSKQASTNKVALKIIKVSDFCSGASYCG